MSKATVASKVVTPSVSIEQFNSALLSIASAGMTAKQALSVACKYITEATNYKDQQASRKLLVKAYKSFVDNTSLKPITLDGANKWVARAVKTLSGTDKFAWIKSPSESAQKKAKSRAARQAKLTGEAPAPAPKTEKKSSIIQLRDALIAKEKKNLDDYINVIPSGKMKEFEQAYAAFIETLTIILK